MNDTAVVTGFLHKGHNHQNCQDEALNRAELSDSDISATIDRKARELGFSMAQQTIEITGVCPACAA
ncbi:hypothetical protein [Desulfurivibrio alkaliphilus]|uniref:Fur family transcriptional regulator n=1 Tax=Desulfurivibrio alkaliphilus (strain DSM 19089 / UNIQEM U267 / AHT2) TaxID=589865 RepID=D6Z068_DESAT|nr:hypothetical protein [Desulfurivibrio alkaliphilus]ADH87101.1 hypothetical protein DaAHT2_2436 [Desulfurivibrio alkaliphilus AHT 2]